MSTNLKQGTKEWREARLGKITGSVVGSVMGCSPFTSRKAALRRMVAESQGDFADFDNEPMRWGRDHEETAAAQYEFLYAGTEPVTETGFWSVNEIGASPDRLVGDHGLLEVKCPYGIRNNASPEFKSIEDKDMRHYWHQIQAQLYCTDRDWCDFFQWTPFGHKVEQVKRDSEWYKDCEPHFQQFMEDYRHLLHKMAEGGAEDKVGLSARWAAAVEDYRLAEITEAAAKADKDKAASILKKLMEANEIDHCEGAGMTANRISKVGTVDYKKLAIEQLTAPVIENIAEDYRRKGSTYYKFTLEGNE